MKKQRIAKTTPIGTFKWFKLIEPDTTYNKYQCDLIVEDSEEVQELIALVEELTEQAAEEARAACKTPLQAKKIKYSEHKPIVPEYNDDGEETGRYVIKSRGNVSYECKKTNKLKNLTPPSIFDASSKPIKGLAKETLKVPNGSQGRLIVELNDYGNNTIGYGVSFKPKAAQIIELSEGDFSSGFDAVDGGFTQEEAFDGYGGSVVYEEDSDF